QQSELYTLTLHDALPILIDANLRQRSAVYKTIEDTLSRVGGRSRDVIAVLPDAAVRVVLLDFDALPTNHEEAEGVVRFRLKKSLDRKSTRLNSSHQIISY